MPWKERNAMDLRYKFVLLAMEPEANLSGLCKSFGINRATGYKWLERYQSGGISHLIDQSRRPKSSPNTTPTEIVLDIVRLRNAKPTWGAKKIKAYLERNGLTDVPARATIEKILVRSGLIERRRRSRTKAYSNEKIIIPQKKHAGKDLPHQQELFDIW